MVKNQENQNFLPKLQQFENNNFLEDSDKLYDFTLGLNNTYAKMEPRFY